MLTKNKLSIVFILVILINIVTIDAFSQRSFGSRIFTGGNLGLQFGTTTLVDVSPMIGYRLTEDIDIGLNLTYKYYKVKDYYYLTQGNKYFDLETNILGGGIFGRYYFMERFFAHAEVEYLNFLKAEYIIYNNGIVKRDINMDVTSIFIGGGIKQSIGDNSFFTIMLLYNLNESQNSPYTNPLIRAGFGIGL